MSKLSNTVLIWNRACGNDALRSLPGDRALADMIGAHGLAMNGGVLHAVECLAPEQLSDACSGYAYFGLQAIASLLSRAKTILDEDDDLENNEQRLDRQYAKIIPDDEALVERFEAHLHSHPSDFSPLRPIDMR